MTLKAFDLTPEMLDHTFAHEVAPDFEKLLTCIQCGTCTASCPTAYAMDYTPRQLWRLVQMGLRAEVLRSSTYWLCTSCYSCSLRCPRGIALTETMATLKRMSIAAGIEEQARINRFYRAFMDTVRHHGRLHEVELMTTYAGRTNPADLVAYAPLGATLLWKGKISLAPKEMTNPGQVEAMFQKAAEIEPGRRE